MSSISTSSSYRTLSEYWDARSQFSTSSPGPPSYESATHIDKQTSELLTQIDNNIIATSTVRGPNSNTLPALLTNLWAYLLAKESDSIPESAVGRPRLNEKIRYAMLKCTDHPRFKDLKISQDGREQRCPDFKTVWAFLERHTREWTAGADRKMRLQEGCNLHKVVFWLMNVELDGESCSVGDENGADDW